MKQHATKDFDLDRPDRRMPYTVPDGFFADLESKILAATVGAEHEAGAESKAGAKRDTGAEHAAAIGTDAAEAPGLKVTPAGTPASKHGRTSRRHTLRPGTLRPGTLRPGTLRPGTLRPGTLRPGTLRRWFVAGAAAVAAAALTTMLLLPRRSDPQPVTYAEVEQVFTQLTDEDQAELLALYRNDPFLNL